MHSAFQRAINWRRPLSLTFYPKRHLSVMSSVLTATCSSVPRRRVAQQRCEAPASSRRFPSQIGALIRVLSSSRSPRKNTFKSERLRHCVRRLRCSQKVGYLHKRCLWPQVELAQKYDLWCCFLTELHFSSRERSISPERSVYSYETKCLSVAR